MRTTVIVYYISSTPQNYIKNLIQQNNLYFIAIRNFYYFCMTFRIIINIMKKSKVLGIMLSAATLFGACTNQAGEAGEEKTNGATDAVIENIMTRASVRQFTSQPISKDTLDILVKAGMAAPSAMDKRPWAFVVVTDRSILDALNDNHPYANLKTATAAIVVCGNLKKASDDLNKDYWVQDCSAASENILLAAHAYGLGAVWCGVYPNPDRVPPIKEVLNIPDYMIPLNIITLGYPAETPQPKDKWNADDVIYQKFEKKVAEKVEETTAEDVLSEDDSKAADKNGKAKEATEKKAEKAEIESNKAETKKVETPQAKPLEKAQPTVKNDSAAVL